MKRPLVTYILIAYSISWILVLSFYLIYKNGLISLEMLNLLGSLGAAGPFISAIITTRIYYKSEGLSKLFLGFSLNRIDKKSLLLSLTPAIFLLTGIMVYPIWKGTAYSFEITKSVFHLNSTLSYLGWIVPFIAYSLFEELGWRGFALPHLQEKYTAFKSSVILTPIIAVWHLPAFLYRLNFSVMITIGFFFGMFIGVVIFTSLFNMSKGSVSLVILFHLANNIASALDRDIIVSTIITGLVFLAVYIFKNYKKENLADKERVKNYFLTEILVRGKL